MPPFECRCHRSGKHPTFVIGVLHRVAPIERSSLIGPREWPQHVPHSRRRRLARRRASVSTRRISGRNGKNIRRSVLGKTRCPSCAHTSARARAAPRQTDHQLPFCRSNFTTREFPPRIGVKGSRVCSSANERDFLLCPRSATPANSSSFADCSPSRDRSASRSEVRPENTPRKERCLLCCRGRLLSLAFGCSEWRERCECPAHPR